MPRAEEFDAFYTSTRARLLHQTYALTGDLGAAASALRHAFATAWQRWPTLRTRDPEAWVRREAGRLAALRHNAHVRRRLDDTGVDHELLAALQALPPLQRRLVLLQTLAELDLGSAAREVGLSAPAALEATDRALATLSAQLAQEAPAGSSGGGAAAGGLEPRMDSLRTVSERVVMPRPDTIRQQGRRRQWRSTVGTVAAATAVVVASGLVVTLPSAAESEPEADSAGQNVSVTEAEEEAAASAAPSQQDAHPRQAPRPEPPGADEDQLLATSQLAGLGRGKIFWRAVPRVSPDAFSVCQPQLSAGPRPRETFVRAFRADSDIRQRAVQSVEVSRTPAAAVGAYRAMLRSYAGCQEPRLQLESRFLVDRPGGDVQILSLHEWRDPVRTVTVAVSRSGVVTTVLAHEVDRALGPPALAMARNMSTALDLLCRTSGGACATPGRPHASPLPPTGEGAGFLGVVDLPPVADLEVAWAGTDPSRTTAANPAATLCDRADFTEVAFVQARSRSFVMPESNLPTRFGLSQTIGLTRTVAQARQFVDATATRVQDCSDRELPAQVVGGDILGRNGVDGRVWQLTFEITDGVEVTYRLGLVQVGSRVAQVSFSGTPEADVGAEAFADLLLRAGQRLRELDGAAS